MSHPITALVIMGVAGCGKTCVSQALCQLSGATAIEGDTFHPAANIEKMSAGDPPERRRPCRLARQPVR